MNKINKVFLIVVFCAIFLAGTLIFFLPDQETQQKAIPLAVIDPEDNSDNALQEIKLRNPQYENLDLDAVFEEEDLNEKVLDFQLKSHPSVTHVKQVGTGKQVVMYYDVNSQYGLSQALGEPDFIDMRTGELVERDWRYVYWGNETYSQDTYECSETTSENGTIIEDCVVNGTIEKTREAWLDYNSRDIPKGQIRLGIEVDVKLNDHIDGVWSVGGKKISKHAVWQASLETDLISWYKLDEQDTTGTGTIIDSHGSNNATNAGADNTTGKIGTAYNFVRANTDKITTTFDVDAYTEFSWHTWVYVTDTSSVQQIIGRDYDSSYGSRRIKINSGNIIFEVQDGSGTKSVSGSITTGWHHIVGTAKEGGNLEFYIDNVSQGTTAITSFGNSKSVLYFGHNPANPHNLDGKLDEIAVWNRELTHEEIGILYNEGNGCTYQLCDAPVDLTLTLLEPVDSANLTTSTNDFTWNVSDPNALGITNTTIEIWNTTGLIYNFTNSSGLAGNYTDSITLNDGDYSWNATAVDSTNNTTSSSATRSLTIDTTPTISVSSPINNTDYDTSSIWFNATSDLSVDYWIINYNGTNLSITDQSGTSLNELLTVEDGSHSLLLYANNSDSGVFGLNNSITDFEVDTTFPQINISHPTDGQNFPYLTNLQNITLNVTATDTNLDTCWYNYNETNTTFSCSTGVLSENNLTMNNESIVTVYANDTFGNTNSSTSDWTFTLFDFEDYTFDSTITESSSTTFIGNFQTGSEISSTFLEYNNSNNSVSIDSLGGNRYTLSSTITSPIVSTDTNISWFFWVNNQNATSQNQTVTNVQLDSCSAFTFPIVNYTLVDELTQNEINNANSSIESQIFLRTLGGDAVAEFNETFTGNPTPAVCSEDNLTSSGLRIWEQSRYGSDDYVFEQRNNQNQSMTTLPKEITLRDLPSDSATTFRITYRSDTFLPVPEAVIEVQRKYIGEGVSKEVESPITDANGEVSASLDLDAVIYRIIVKQNGQTLSTFENPAVSCDNILTGDCTITLNERDSVNQINNYDAINNFNYGLKQNNRTITLTFEIPNRESKSVNLFVNQSTILGNSTACNQTLLASSGKIDCIVDDSLDDVFTSIKVSSDGKLITTASATILEDRSQYFGTDNIVLTFFLVLSITLLMVSDPIAVLIGIAIGLISSGLMLFINSGSIFGTTSVVMYLIVVIVIMLIKVAYRQRI